MAVRKVSQHDALLLSESGCDSPEQKLASFYDTFGTEGCTLNCVQVNRQFGQDTKVHGRTAKRIKRLSEYEDIKQFWQSLQMWYPLSAFTASAGAGCGSCEVLSNLFSAVFLEDQPLQQGAFEYSVTERFNLKRRVIGTTEPLECVQLFQPQGFGVRFQRFHSSNFIFGTDLSIHRLREWMADCEQNHAACSPLPSSQDSGYRPTRLLDLTPLHQNSEPGIRLTEDIRSSYKYACLSHRWDEGVEQCATTAGNLMARQHFIGLKSLPVNFQHGIKIARELAIPYLWIDSLCIIQKGDKGADKAREIAKMSAIYRYSYLTIAAVSSRSSMGGCFRPGSLPDLCLSAKDPTGAEYWIGARMVDKKGKPASKLAFDERYPLLTRAWVFQERQLSPRFLQCSYGEFEFTCRGLSRCECESRIAPHPSSDCFPGIEASADAAFHRHLLHSINDETPHSGETQFSESIRFWRQSVQAYMRLDLKYSSDVLPAIAGCAQVIAPRMKTDYVAGLWRSTLAKDLLWYVGTRRGYTRERPQDSTVPSWSWASLAMGTSINYINSTSRNGDWTSSQTLLDRRIIHVQCTPKSDAHRFGELIEAYLELRAALFPWYLCFRCHRRTRRHAQCKLHMEDPTRARDCTPAIPGLPLEGIRVDLISDTPVKSEMLTTVTVDSCVPEYSQWPSCALALVYLLPVLHMEAPNRLFDMFLVLKRISADTATGGQYHRYKRIGAARVSSKEPNVRTWEEITAGRIEPLEETFRIY